jgi:hypothetical protein
MLYDLFISHASEDKEPVVRPLAHRLVQQHLTVWYDEYELKLGDSLRQTIDRGLAESQFGVVILSPAFFAKNWPQYELDGLVTRENLGGTKIVLPIWHGVNADFIARYSPTLAGRYAVSTEEGLDRVVAAIVEVIRPRPSPLIVARDELIAWGLTPPIVTDEYWLDVVEASNRVPATGAMVPEESTWGRWTFPLPSLDGTPDARGLRLAWTALQLAWTADAEHSSIDLTSEPSVVHAFLQRHPALVEACLDFPFFLAEYAPQLTIPGFGAEFEAVFEERYQASLSSPPNPARPDELCAEEWMLRHPQLAGYSDHSIAYNWFSAGMFGPDVRLHGFTDYLFWLLSRASAWIPSHIRRALTSGMFSMWSSWLWNTVGHDQPEHHWRHRGALQKAFWEAEKAKRKDLWWTDSVAADVTGRAAAAAVTLALPETAEDLACAFRQSEATRLALASERKRRSVQRRSSKPRKRSKAQ